MTTHASAQALMVTNNMPNEKLIRLGTVLEWLGCNPRDVDKWVEFGVIHRLPPNHEKLRLKGFYDRDEIRRKVLGEKL